MNSRSGLYLCTSPRPSSRLLHRSQWVGRKWSTHDTLLLQQDLITRLTVFALDASELPERAPRVRALLAYLLDALECCEEELGSLALAVWLIGLISLLRVAQWPAGRRTMNAAPCPAAERTVIPPPWRRAIA